MRFEDLNCFGVENYLKTEDRLMLINELLGLMPG